MRVGIIHTYLRGKDPCNIGENAVDRISRFLLEQNSNIRLSVFEATLGELPKSLNECDCYIISGSKFGVYEPHSWIPSLENWIKQAHINKHKLFGICFGHQIIAQALDGKLIKGESGYNLGIFKSKVCSPQAIKLISKPEFNAYYAHQDIVIKIPPQALNLFSTEHCQHAGFAIGNHIMTMQSHPEYTNEYMLTVLKTFAHMLSEKTKEACYHSVSLLLPDRKVLAEYILSFLFKIGD